MNLQNIIFNRIRMGKLLFILFLVTLVPGASAQKNTGAFHILGRIRVDNGDPAGAVINLSNLSAKTSEAPIQLDATGKFEFILKYFTEYRMVVVKEGHYPKEIDISTIIPSQVWAKDSLFPPYPIVVTIYKKVPDVTLSFEGKTVGKICYSPNGKLDNFDADIFISDKDIRREIDQALKEKDDAVFNQKMAEAIEFEKKNQIREALKAYEEALAMRKNDQFIKPKIKELNSDLKNLEKDQLNEAEFIKLLAAGDDNVSKQKYPEAIDNFKAALSMKPGDQAASAKLSNAEQLLAALNADKSKLDAEFNRLLALGDANVTGKKYPEAIDNFKSALVIKANDKIASGKLANAEQLLAGENATKAKLDAEFYRLLASGDENVSGKKYPEAILNFKGALTIKAGDPTATGKLANAEQLLAALNADKAKQDAEFVRLIATGDRNVSDQKYPEAIDNFKGALSIKTGDKTASSKLDNAERLLDAFNADIAKRDAEFRRLLAAGDENVSGKKYPEAILDFKGALTLKAGDPTATTKLANAEQLLAALNADNAKQEAEFARLVAAGDQNVSDQKYPEAIDNFKGALKIKTGNQIASSKLANAERLLAALNADKAKQEAEFNRLLAAGDDNVTKQRFEDAVGNFKSALVIKVGDKIAADKLANAEQLLAKANAERAKLGEEFNRLLASGDANVTAKKYPEGVTDFTGALKLKPGDPVAARKLSDAEQLLARQIAEKTRLDAEFNNMLALGDGNVIKQKYEDAINNFNLALQIKPGDKTATDKLANAQQLLAKTNADKAKLEEEFNRLLASGDANVAGQKYSEGIADFKDALKLKPADLIATRKLSDAERLLAQFNAEKQRKEAELKLLADKEKKYKETIARADQLYDAKSWSESKGQYREAIRISDSEKYPKDRIDEIDAILAKIASDKLLAQQQAVAQRKLQGEDSYLKNMQTGDANFAKSLWTVAIFYYQAALKYKASDKNAIAKIEDCNKMIDSNITAEKMQDYNNNIRQADEDMKVKQYSSARFYYGKASEILPWENYPKDQLKVVEKVIASTDYSGIDAQYFEAIKKADEAVTLKNYAIARFYFQRAISLKPDEEYPKQQLKRLTSEN